MSERTACHHRKGEALEYRLLLAVSYPIFLVGAVLGRILPVRRSGGGRRANARLSVFGEARAAADTYVPFAFMG